MASIRHKLLEHGSADMDQGGVVTTLKIYLRLVRQTVVHDHPKAVRGTQRRHGARFTIEEESLDLFLIRDVHIGPELLPQFAEMDVPGGRQYREHKSDSALEHDRLGNAIGRDTARRRTLRSRLSVGMFDYVVWYASLGQILRNSDCNAHGLSPDA
jgi:hypothetical protein